MNDVDLTHVDPVRQAEVRRRISVIKSQLAIARPTAEQTEANAVSLGLSTSQFYRLVRSWRLHGQAALVAGAGAHGRPRRRPDGVSPDAKAVVAAVIGELGVEASQTAIHLAIVARCEALGIDPPSKGAVWTYIMAARSRPDRRGSGPIRLLVARCHARVPTLIDDSTVFPELSICLLLPERRIVGIDVAIGPEMNAKASRALRRALSTLPGGPFRGEVILDAGDASEARDVHIALLGRPPQVSRSSVSQELSRALGREVGGMRILHRGHTARIEGLLGSSLNLPVDVETAERHIGLAVANHNAGLATIRVVQGPTTAAAAG